ncbi:MAG: acetate/propionate family kinase [Christensenellaceae bacterium]|jgi:acetate kinase
MNVLVCNAGSTSLKMKLYRMPAEEILAECKMDRIGDATGSTFSYQDEYKKVERNLVLEDYAAGLSIFCEELGEAQLGDISAVGFKTVLAKGFTGVHKINAAVLAGMEEYLPVAPIHNTCYMEVIRVFQARLPDIPLIGAFETAFHETLGPEAYLYSVPYEWYETYGIRKYGYHGASHAYVADVLNEKMGHAYRAVSCHLGGSSSLCAIVDGKSIDTSFGLSLQVGVPQGSRNGDIDPFLIFYLLEKGLSLNEIKQQLEENGGLLGISGVSGDMRDLQNAASAGNERAGLAIDIYCREIARYIGGYTALMGGLDVVAFTGGVGENSSHVREKVLSYLTFLGMGMLQDAKRGKISKITGEDSRIAAYVIPANEELGVARKTYAALQG